MEVLILKNFKSQSDRDEFRSFWKIENMQNTNSVENIQIDNDNDNLGFSSSGLLNDQFSLMDLSEMTGLDVYNKTERK